MQITCKYQEATETSSEIAMKMRVNVVAGNCLFICACVCVCVCVGFLPIFLCACAEDEEEGGGAQTAVKFMATLADYSPIRTCGKLLW